MLEKIKDPGSAITHFIGMLMAMFAATPLIIKSLHEPDYIHVISLTVFIVSMILLYAASTIYHTLNLSEKTNRILRKTGSHLAMHIQFRIAHLFKRLPAEKSFRFFHRHRPVFYFFQNFLYFHKNTPRFILSSQDTQAARPECR